MEFPHILSYRSPRRIRLKSLLFVLFCLHNLLLLQTQNPVSFSSPEKPTVDSALLSHFYTPPPLPPPCYDFPSVKCACRISVTKAWETLLYIKYTHFSYAAAPLFAQGTAAVVRKMTKNMLSTRWRCLKQLTGFAPDALYTPWGIIPQHISYFPIRPACDMKYAICNIMPVYLCYEAGMLFISLSN